jgi:hypothetical protein
MTMATKEIVKIAPALSAEERFRMMLPDLIRLQDEKQPLLSATEMDAIRTCPRGEVLEGYGYRVSLFSWITMIWLRDWNAIRTRVSLFGLVMLYEFERTLRDAENPDDKDPFDLVRSMAAAMEATLEEFYAYRASIPLLEGELCGLPFFGEEKRAGIDHEYSDTEEFIVRYNEMVEVAFTPAKGRPKRSTEDRERCLIRKPAENPERAEAIVLNLTSIAQADARRGR